MKRILLPIAIIFLLFGCTNKTEKEIVKEKEIEIEKEFPEKDGMFVHISSNDPHRVIMGLSLANKLKIDHDVILFFDTKGIENILKDSEDITNEGFEKSSKTILKELLDSGIEIMACPMCLKSYGKSKEDLITGIILADKDKFFNFTKGRILTLDY